MSTRRPRTDHDGEEERILGALLARLRPRRRVRPGWEDAFTARVLARARGELTRRAETPSWWQLIARWPAPLVPAAAAALAIAIVVAGNGGFATASDLADGSDVTAALAGDPLSAVVTDPVLALFAADGTGEVSP